MKRLRIVLAGILLTLPLLSLDASPSADVSVAVNLEQTHGVTATCYMFWNGRWYAYPC